MKNAAFFAILLSFGRPTPKRTSPIDSSQLFALDTPIISSLRTNLIKNELVFDEMVNCFVDHLLILEHTVGCLA